MRRLTKTTAILLAPLAVAAMAVAPGPDADCRLIRGAETPETTDDVEVCELQTYFHRATSPVGNLGHTAADTFPSFDEIAPASRETGSGGVFVTPMGDAEGAEPTEPVYEGDFTGNIDTLHVTQYLTAGYYGALGAPYPLNVSLSVDGVSILSFNAGDTRRVPMIPVEDGLSRMDFTITNVHDALEFNGIETGDDITHTVRLRLANFFDVNGQDLFWYDAAEFASGIYFNRDASKIFGTKYDAVAD